MVKLQTRLLFNYWNLQSHGFYQDLMAGLASKQPHADTTRMREAGVELVGVSGGDNTGPFAERSGMLR
jgi:hypothetical protein